MPQASPDNERFEQPWLVQVSAVHGLPSSQSAIQPGGAPVVDRVEPPPSKASLADSSSGNPLRAPHPESDAIAITRGMRPAAEYWKSTIFSRTILYGGSGGNGGTRERRC